MAFSNPFGELFVDDIEDKFEDWIDDANDVTEDNVGDSLVDLLMNVNINLDRIWEEESGKHQVTFRKFVIFSGSAAGQFCSA